MENKNKLVAFLEQPKNQEKIKEIKKNLQQLSQPKTKNKPVLVEKIYKHLADVFCGYYQIYYDNTKTWWYWFPDELIWKMIEQIEIEIQYEDLLTVLEETTNISITHLHQTQKNLIDVTLKHKAHQRQFENISSEIIFFKDRGINVLTNKTIIAEPKYFITNKINHKLGISEETPTIDKIFKEWVGCEYLLLEEIIAYSMYRGYPLQKFFINYGLGRNGKSSYETFVKRVLGKENMIASDIELIVKGKFESSRFDNKLVCTISEVDKMTKVNTAIIKRLTGGEDLVHAEKKFKDAYEFTNYAKIIISTNYIPEFQDTTPAFFRRPILINFPNQFTSARDILEDIKQEEYENFCRKCVGLLKNILISREFTTNLDPYETEEKKKIYYNAAYQNLTKYISEDYTLDSTEYIDFSSFYEGYLIYCKVNKIVPEKEKTIGYQLNILGYRKSNYPYTKEAGAETSKVVIWGLKEKE